MKTIFSTSIEFIETTDDGEQFISSTVFPNAYGNTEKESVDNAIAGFEANAKSYGWSANDILSITTVELDD